MLTFHDLLDHRAASAVVVVVVTRCQGSTPCAPGNAMLIGADDSQGTIGGGHLEWQVMALARQMLKQVPLHAGAQPSRGDGGADVHRSTMSCLAAAGDAAFPTAPPAADHSFALGPSLGQCCGGRVEVHLQYLSPFTAPRFPEGVLALRAPASLPLTLFGAGHVGQALVHTLATLPCRVKWVDSREDVLAKVSLPPNAIAVHSDSPEAEINPGEASAYVVMTHNHALDFTLCEAILKSGSALFLGMIGSESKAARFRHRLQERGLTDTAKLHCPIGLPGIKGKEPAVIALAIAAQLMTYRDWAAAGPDASGRSLPLLQREGGRGERCSATETLPYIAATPVAAF